MESLLREEGSRGKRPASGDRGGGREETERDRVGEKRKRERKRKRKKREGVGGISPFKEIGYTCSARS